MEWKTIPIFYLICGWSEGYAAFTENEWKRLLKENELDANSTPERG